MPKKCKEMWQVLKLMLATTRYGYIGDNFRGASDFYNDQIERVMHKMNSIEKWTSAQLEQAIEDLKSNERYYINDK